MSHEAEKLLNRLYYALSKPMSLSRQDMRALAERASAVTVNATHESAFGLRGYCSHWGRPDRW